MDSQNSNPQIWGKDLEIFFITFDEPLKDQYWEIISDMIPHARRVDSVKGFDKAYKACARQVESDRFISIDGDNSLLHEFTYFTIDKELMDSPYVLSWASKNSINGLCYGNGGVKCWPKKVTNNMKSHENSTEEKTAVDFYFETQYYLMPEVLSVSNIHHTPYQAFRAGYRESIKMSLVEGEKLKSSPQALADGELVKQVPKANMDRLRIWSSVGADVENGLWAIYGARLGLKDLYLNNEPLENIRDYDWFNEFWDSNIKKQFDGTEEKCHISHYSWDKSKLLTANKNLKDELNQKLKIEITDLNAEQSAFFKSTYRNKERKGLLR